MPSSDNAHQYDEVKKEIFEESFDTLIRVASIWYNKMGDDQKSIDQALKDLFDLDEEQYLMIYKKNKIEEYEIDSILPNLIQIASVHQSIVNTLDNTFMITKKNSEIIFLNLKTLIYKYRGFE